MRRFYQESWQGIPFTTFAHTHFFHLADAKFYSVFYEELFRRYQSWEDLPEVWRRNKTADALWIASRLKKMQEEKTHDSPLRVLSIGSGVGFMERMLLKEMGDSIELYVNEPSTVCMKWLRRLIPADRIFIGQPPDCLSPDIYYDMIYLSAVDYGIPQAQLTHTLDSLRYQLLPSGEILCLSASLLEECQLLQELHTRHPALPWHTQAAVLGLAQDAQRIQTALCLLRIQVRGRRFSGRWLWHLLDTGCSTRTGKAG